MRYLTGLPDHEGSVWTPSYNRAGCRTPMQWDEALPNAGFSTAEKSRLYLPQDPAPDRPTVSAQRDDPNSTLRLVRRLIPLRRSVPELGTEAATRVLTTDCPLAYLRGDRHLVVVNPRRDAAAAQLPGQASGPGRLLEGQGVQVTGGLVEADGFGYGVFALD